MKMIKNNMEIQIIKTLINNILQNNHKKLTLISNFLIIKLSVKDYFLMKKTRNIN